MDTYKYTCGYCSKDYKPRRRRVQKYCSTSCRVGAFKLKNKKRNLQETETLAKESSNRSPIKIEQPSMAGVANAALGSAAVGALTKLLTKPENKPATKGDIDRIVSLIQNRYLPILNLKLGTNASKPHYDIVTKKVIYLNI